MRMNCKAANLVASLATALALSVTAPCSVAQTNAFTYQGQLTAAGTPANGSYDVIFQLFDAPTGGNQINVAITNANLAVSNGLFAATLDFGSGAFTGSDRWLQIAVRTNGGPEAPVPLTPRQLLTPVPYALHALSANMAQTAGNLTAANITPGGTLPELNLTNLTNSTGESVAQIASNAAATTAFIVAGTNPCVIIYTNPTSGDVPALTVVAASTNAGWYPTMLLLKNQGDRAGGQDWQNEVRLKFQAGTTNNHRKYLHWLDYNGLTLWENGVNAQSVYIIYDGQDGNHRLWIDPTNLASTPYITGNTYLNGTGPGGIVVGADTGGGAAAAQTGTGGLIVYSGGLKPAIWFAVTNGNSALKGSLSVGNMLTAANGLIAGTNGGFTVDDNGDVVGNTLTVKSINAATANYSSSSTNNVMNLTTVGGLTTPTGGTCAMAYCTDVVTSQGVGGYVYWDPVSSVWRNAEHVIVTTSITNFIPNSLEAGLNVNTKYGRYYLQPWSYHIPNGQGRISAAAGTSASVQAYGTASYIGVLTAFSIGTTASGVASAYDELLPALTPTANMISSGGSYAGSTAPNGTDNYWVFVGMEPSVTTTYPTTGCGFIFDPYLANNVISNATMTAHWTNNWIAMTANASAYSYMDTGVAFSTSLTAPNRLISALSYDNASFFTNGVLAGVIRANLPSSGLPDWKGHPTENSRNN